MNPLMWKKWILTKSLATLICKLLKAQYEFSDDSQGLNAGQRPYHIHYMCKVFLQYELIDG